MHACTHTYMHACTDIPELVSHTREPSLSPPPKSQHHNIMTYPSLHQSKTQNQHQQFQLRQTNNKSPIQLTKAVIHVHPCPFGDPPDPQTILALLMAHCSSAEKPLVVKYSIIRCTAPGLDLTTVNLDQLLSLHVPVVSLVQGHNGLGHNSLDHNGLDHNGLDHNGLDNNCLDHNGLDHNSLDLIHKGHHREQNNFPLIEQSNFPITEQNSFPDLEQNTPPGRSKMNMHCRHDYNPFRTATSYPPDAFTNTPPANNNNNNNDDNNNNSNNNNHNNNHNNYNYNNNNKNNDDDDNNNNNNGNNNKYYSPFSTTNQGTMAHHQPMSTSSPHSTHHHAHIHQNSNTHSIPNQNHSPVAFQNHSPSLKSKPPARDLVNTWGDARLVIKSPNRSPRGVMVKDSSVLFGYGQGCGEGDYHTDGVCVNVKDVFEVDLMREISERQRRLRTLLKRDEDFVLESNVAQRSF